MANIDTKLGAIDSAFLDQRQTPIDDDTRYGVRIEVVPKPLDQLAAMRWEEGDEAHPNCGHGVAVSMHVLNDTKNPETGEMGPGTIVMHREEFHPPNCVVAKLVKAQGQVIAVYERIYWTKANPFVETPDEVEVDLGDGKLTRVLASTLTRKVERVENDNEFTHAEEYRDFSGRIVKRSVDVKLKKSSATAAGATAGF